MSLSKPTDRQRIHTRQIHCEGFQRHDGLWDIEASLVDTKSFTYSNHDRGDIPAGEPIHDMKIRITLDLEMQIHHVETCVSYTPFRICPNAAASMKRIEGLRVGSGWMREVRKLIPFTDSCTHLIELLGPISTTAYQTMHRALEEKAERLAQRQNQTGTGASTIRSIPPILNQCHSLGSDTLVVKAIWPEFYTGKE
ncbi:MAG: DUF2889 domain-containing protein [Gammaproteobacteria bacterium]|nr:DUF2889 domain-containing protein [Gammaproteobacteria bacterium]